MTREQLKNKFRKEGKTFSDWAKENGYRYHAVLLVMGGLSKCSRGNANEIANKLGLTFPIR